MAYFPKQIMPKMLVKETSKEVDDNPSIENAKDWNSQHREIRAIEKFLIGNDPSGGLMFAGSNLQGTTQLPESLSDGVNYIKYLIEELFNGCWFSQYTGTVRYKNFIELPSCITKTKTTGAISSSSSAITVETTAGFPRSGTITKINGLRTGEYCQSGTSASPVGGGAVCSVGTKYITYTDFTATTKHRTNQEIITYTDKNETQFLNCTRSVSGSTAETITDDEKSVIICGNASISISHNFWAELASQSPNACEIYVSMTPDLYVDGSVLKRGTNQVVNHIEDFIEISYSLMLISDFQDVSISDQINAGGNNINSSIISSAPAVSSTPVPISPPEIIQSEFFRLDTMSIFSPFWWTSNSLKGKDYWFQHNGIVVLPLAWINGTSKTVSYGVSQNKNSTLNAKLNGSNVISLNSDINTTYARFYNHNASAGSYGDLNRVEIIFKNYKTYGLLTTANVSFTVTGTLLGNKPFYESYSDWSSFGSNIKANLSISDSSEIIANSQFEFSFDSSYKYNYRTLISSSNVSYIVPNQATYGWENYFNI